MRLWWVDMGEPAEACDKAPTEAVRDPMPSLAEGLLRYAKEVSPRKAEGVKEAGKIRKFVREELALCSMPMDQVTPRMIKECVMSWHVTGSTANRRLAFVSHLYTVAASDWFLPVASPIVRGIRRKENAARTRRLEGADEFELMAHARVLMRELKPPIDIEKVVSFAVDTAARLSEIERCRWKDINLSERTVLIRKTKNTHPRTVPLWPATAKMLAGMERRADGLVFGPAGQISRCWAELIGRTTLDDFRFHDLRHEAISRFFERTDLTDVEIASISGHRTMAMLKRYAHLRANKLAVKLDAASLRPSQKFQGC